MPEQFVNDDGEHVPTARGHSVIMQKKGELALKKKQELHGLGSLIKKGLLLQKIDESHEMQVSLVTTGLYLENNQPI